MSPIRPITKNGKFETTFSALGIPEKNKRNKHAGSTTAEYKRKETLDYSARKIIRIMYIAL